MAENTTPAAKRTPAAKKATTPRKTAPKATPAPAPVKDDSVSTLILEHVGSTKTYEKFSPEAGSGCTGTLYATKGTKVVKVRLER